MKDERVEEIRARLVAHTARGRSQWDARHARNEFRNNAETDIAYLLGLVDGFMGRPRDLYAVPKEIEQ